MSVEFRPFKMRDLDTFEVQPLHKIVLHHVRTRPFVLMDAEDSVWSFTMWAEGKPKACAGVMDDGGLWVFLASDLRRYMVQLTRYGMSMIDAHHGVKGPVHAQICPSHAEAVRWVRLAGFRQITSSVWVYP